MTLRLVKEEPCVISPGRTRLASQSHHLTSGRAGDGEQYAGASFQSMEFCRGVVVRLEFMSGAMGE